MYEKTIITRTIHSNQTKCTYIRILFFSIFLSRWTWEIQNSWKYDDELNRWIRFSTRIEKKKTKNKTGNKMCMWVKTLCDFPHSEIQYRIIYGWIKLYGFFFGSRMCRLDCTTYSKKKENVFFNWIYRFRRFSLSLSLALFVSVYVRSMSS